jgi:hypothetical protein
MATTLDQGRRTPFGAAAGETSVGQAALLPGDWLALHTDGAPEASAPDGAPFGQPRLVGLLERAAASDHPPAEIVRRLVHAVLAHAEGVLQDDATLLLGHLSPAHGWSDGSEQGDRRPETGADG